MQIKNFKNKNIKDHYKNHGKLHYSVSLKDMSFKLCFKCLSGWSTSQFYW